MANVCLLPLVSPSLTFYPLVKILMVAYKTWRPQCSRPATHMQFGAGLTELEVFSGEDWVVLLAAGVL